MGVYIKGMEMPEHCGECKLTAEYDNETFCPFFADNVECWIAAGRRHEECPLVNVPPHGRLRRRMVYRGEVYNALESARVNALDGILSDPYKEGFHDGIKRAIQILANEVEDAPTVIGAEEVYGQYTDAAGNYHWCGTHSGEHKIKTEEGE